MRILIIGDINSVYVKEFARRIKGRHNISFDIFTLSKPNLEHDKELYDNIQVVQAWNGFRHIPLLRTLIVAAGFRKKMKSLRKYDICHIHFIDSFYGIFASIIKDKCKYLLTSFWGSDLYQTKNIYRILQKRLLAETNIITFASTKFSDDFIKIFGNSYLEKFRIVRFGLAPLEKFRDLEAETRNESRLFLKLPQDSLIITCAYSGTPVHRHLQILDSIIKISQRLPKNILLVFPIAYGGTQEYKKKIKERLRTSNFRYKIIEEFLPDEDIARLRKASDFLINVPETDALSGTMQEHLYAGNIVITGDWLPYDLLDEKGVFMLKVSSVKEVGEQLIYAIKSYDSFSKHTSKSKDIIWELSSWDANIPTWLELYQELKTPDTINKSTFCPNIYAAK